MVDIGEEKVVCGKCYGIARDVRTMTLYFQKKFIVMKILYTDMNCEVFRWDLKDGHIESEARGAVEERVSKLGCIGKFPIYMFESMAT
jgi:hypothetical protein